MFNFDFGILGNNSRNINYIKKFNPKKSIHLADNKFKTKKFLFDRGIPVPQTYGFIENRNGLDKFNFDDIKNNFFVIKPNNGSKGQGILICEKILGKDINISNFKNNSFLYKLFGNFYEKKINPYENYIKVGDEIFDIKTFKKKLIDILDGKYSLTMGKDSILIEEKLMPTKEFSIFCEHGLADIRIIVFNLVPIGTMVRVPTFSSGGKANLAQGGIGFGIEIGTGRIASMFYKKKIFTNNFPGFYSNIYRKKIEYREEILILSSKIQYFVNLGYLALDWVITSDGPKILEINARAGLEIQNVNLVPLKGILNKISDLVINDPSKGVEIGKILFNKAKSPVNIVKKVIYLSQKGKIGYKDIETGSIKEIDNILVIVDLNKEKNYISKTIEQEIIGKKINLFLKNNDIILKNLEYQFSTKISGNKIILGKNILKDFYIIPKDILFRETNFINKKNIFEEEIDNLILLDQEIYDIQKEIHIGGFLKPTNFLEQLDIFINNKFNYNPVFKYKRPNDEFIEKKKEQLSQIKEKYFGKSLCIKSNFGKLFIEKIQELEDKIDLIKSYKYQDLDKILFYNEKLYGKLTDKYNEIIDKIINEYDNNSNMINSKLLSIEEVIYKLKKYLEIKNISNYKIEICQNKASRISISNGKIPKINISNVSKFYEESFYSILAHEIDVHLERIINGKKNGWKILQNGSGYYLTDEEGFAVYNSEKIENLNRERFGKYLSYHYVQMAQKMNFVELFNYLKNFKVIKNNNFDINYIFIKTTKFKNGIKNTAIKNTGCVYLRSKIYLDGYLKIKKYVENGGNIDKLKIGKIKIEDIENIF